MEVSLNIRKKYFQDVKHDEYEWHFLHMSRFPTLFYLDLFNFRIAVHSERHLLCADPKQALTGPKWLGWMEWLGRFQGFSREKMGVYTLQKLLFLSACSFKRMGLTDDYTGLWSSWAFQYYAQILAGLVDVKVAHVSPWGWFIWGLCNRKGVQPTNYVHPCFKNNPQYQYVPHKAVAEVSTIGNL